MSDLTTPNTKSFATRCRAVIHRDWVIYLIIIVFSAGVGLTGLLFSTTANVHYLIYSNAAISALLVGGGFMFVAFLTRLILKLHPRPLLAVGQLIAKVLRRPEEILGFILIFIGMEFFISAFTSLKSMIPILHPFDMDESFAAMDRWLHFGIDPWRLTHALNEVSLAASAMLTGVLTFLYALWFFLFWTVLLFFMIRPDTGRLRQQYLISYFLCWVIIGGVFAILLSSAGPVYYNHLVAGTDPFVPLMEVLTDQNEWLTERGGWLRVWPLEIQDKLWETYSNSETTLGSGISAMPSMHVAIAVLMALGVSRLNRKLGFVFWIFALLIQIGSVHLAWHYAIDGYLAAILTVIIWKIAGRLTAKLMPAAQS